MLCRVVGGLDVYFYMVPLRLEPGAVIGDVMGYLIPDMIGDFIGEIVGDMIGDMYDWRC